MQHLFINIVPFLLFLLLFCFFLSYFDGTFLLWMTGNSNVNVDVDVDADVWLNFIFQMSRTCDSELLWGVPPFELLAFHTNRLAMPSNCTQQQQQTSGVEREGEERGYIECHGIVWTTILAQHQAHAHTHTHSDSHTHLVLIHTYTWSVHKPFFYDWQFLVVDFIFGCNALASSILIYMIYFSYDSLAAPALTKKTHFHFTNTYTRTQLATRTPAAFRLRWHYNRN